MKTYTYGVSFTATLTNGETDVMGVSCQRMFSSLDKAKDDARELIPYMCEDLAPGEDAFVNLDFFENDVDVATTVVEAHVLCRRDKDTFSYVRRDEPDFFFDECRMLRDDVIAYNTERGLPTSYNVTLP